MTQFVARELVDASRNGAATAGQHAKDALPVRLLGPMTGRRAVALCGLFAAMAFLGGCQVLEPILASSGAWAERQVEAGWSEVRKIPGLRKAPRDVAVFQTASTDDAGLNTDLLRRKVWVAQMAVDPRVEREAIDRTLDNGVMVFRPGHGSRTIRTPSYGAAPMIRPRVRQVAQPAARPVERAPDAVSYVKLDGSLDMADWSACEQSVGGAFLVSPQGTRVAPDFDACMRSEGYVSEAEAEASLAGGL